jgi:type IV pilus assembly protein PilB
MARNIAKKTKTTRSARGSGRKTAKKTPPPTTEHISAASELLDMDGAIKLLKTSRPTFYRWVRTGKIRGMKVGRQWRFEPAEIERFLKGEEPRIELRADIRPLIKMLRGRLLRLKGKDPSRPADDPLRKVVVLMIALAAKMRTSDLHIEPYESGARIRCRVDGVLQPVGEFDLRLLPPIVEQLKRMGGCDVMEKKLPQDGRCLMHTEDIGFELALRMCFVPAYFGEAVTLRLLRRDAPVLSWDGLGYAPRDQEKIIGSIEAPSGLIVVSGPTGTGKTTTLYTCLNHIADPGLKIMTVESPVEYVFPSMVQAQLNEGAGATFPRMVRHFLRSAPNVIMIGEIRDRETLQLAHQAALVGLLVLTTLHAEDSPKALVRMLEIGSPPFLVSDSTRLVISQRLVRRLCEGCSVPADPPADSMTKAEQLSTAGGINWASLPKKFRKPVGCPKCAETGYRGRTIIAEVLEMSPQIREALCRKAAADELRSIAVQQGMTTMGADGIRRAAAGETTIDEVLRILPPQG